MCVFAVISIAYVDLSHLQISDPYALRILINQAHIENLILAETRRDAERTLRTLRGGGVAWSADKFIVRVYPCVFFFSHRFYGGPVLILCLQ